MSHQRSLCMALSILFLAVALLSAPAPAKPRLTPQYLFGLWRQTYGPFVTQTQLNTDFVFRSITVRPGTSYRLQVTGTWKLEGNMFWMTWVEWYPHTMPKPLPEGTAVEVIDDNHFRNKLGIVTRVTR